MDSLKFIVDLIGNPLSVLFVIQLGAITFLVIVQKYNKEKFGSQQEQISALKKDLKELKEKYHLLNNMVEKVALFIEPIIKRKLIKQAPGGEWTAHNPLSGD